MSLGNTIVRAAPPHGLFFEGTIATGQTPKPGTVMQIVAASAEVGGRFQYTAYNPGTDGEQRPIIVLREDDLQGKAMTVAYAAGDRCFLYCPGCAGEELNMLKGDESGTADDIAVGSVFMVDTGTGKLLHTTGSPESEPFIALEAVVDPAADQLVRCMYTGY